MPSCMARAYTLASVAPAVPSAAWAVAGRQPGCGSRAVRSGVLARDAAADAIELHEADGALERIEAWLRERGFFAPGGEELVADLYLGYGLSSTIRRQHSPRPPEPCPLPLAACSVRAEEYVVEMT